MRIESTLRGRDRLIDLFPVLQEGAMGQNTGFQPDAALMTQIYNMVTPNNSRKPDAISDLISLSRRPERHS